MVAVYDFHVSFKKYAVFDNRKNSIISAQISDITEKRILLRTTSLQHCPVKAKRGKKKHTNEKKKNNLVYHLRRKYTKQSSILRTP